MTRTFIRLAPFAIAACLLGAGTGAGAQNRPDSVCPSAQSMTAAQLHGRWAVRFANAPAGLPERATLLLQRHEEFSESLAGTISRKLKKSPSAAPGRAAQAALAGDLDEGVLMLDESSDLVNTTATWTGEMVPGSCGKAFRGTWKDISDSAAPDAPDVAFTLTRLP